jgi:peroxiredoxin
MPRTRQDWIILTLVVTLLGSVWVGMTRVKPGQVNPSGRPPSPDIGYTAPDFTLLTPGGEELSLSDFRGKPVLLNFWATWCPPCRAEIPALEQASRQLEGRAVILGVDVQESPGTVQAFMEEAGITYAVVIDPDAVVAHTYRIRAYPTTYFIDPRGVIVELYNGPMTEPLIFMRLDDLAGR